MTAAFEPDTPDPTLTDEERELTIPPVDDVPDTDSDPKVDVAE